MKRKHGYRKFKGIGLASAVIGFTLLSAPVYAESSDGGGLVNTTEDDVPHAPFNTLPQPSGSIIEQGEDGVPWELYENGYLLFRPEYDKNTLSRDDSWKYVRNQVKFIGFSGKTYAPTNSSHLFASMGNTIFIDTYYLDTSNVTDMSNMFKGLPLVELDVSNMITSNVTDMSYMFSGLSKLTSLNLSNFKTSNVRDMHGMFFGSNGLTSLNVSNFDTSNVTDMSQMFASLHKLTSLNVSNFDTSNVTNMSRMFSNLRKLTSLNVSQFNTSHVENMGSMFEGSQGLETLDLTNFDTSNVKNMSHMFDGLANLKSLDVTRFNTKNVTDMSAMFQGMSQLSSLDVTKFDTHNVDNMSSMFQGMSNLASLDVTHFDTSKVTSMFGMFGNDISLTTLDLSNFDTRLVTDMITMFLNMPKLKELKLSDKFKANGIRTIMDTHAYGDKYTNRWYNVNDEDNTMTVSEWAATYAANPTANAGTWVREEKTENATLKFQGETFTPVKVKPSDTVLPTLPRPSWPKQNHKFIGWSKDGRNPITRDEVKPGETITLQPLWQPVDNTTIRNGEIPVTTTYRGDDNLDVGKRQETPGTPGEKRITTTYTSAPYTGELTNPVESTEIIRNMTPKVITIGTKPTSTVENIPSPKVYQADPSRPRNSEDVVTQGQPGSKTTTTTYTVNPNTGQVTSKRNQPVIKQPTNTIVKVATQDKVTNTLIQPTKRYEADPSRARGERDITTPGTPGNTRTVTTYTVNPNTGQVTEQVGQPTVTKPATDTVIKIASQDKVSKSNPVERTTRVNKDNTKPLGYKQVDTEGSDGYTETITHYDVDPTTGNVTERIETRTVPPVERVVTEGALAYDLPTTGTADMTITLAGLAGTLVITKRKKTK